MVADKRNEPLPESIVFVLQSRQLVHPMRSHFVSTELIGKTPDPAVCGIQVGGRMDGVRGAWITILLLDL